MNCDEEKQYKVPAGVLMGTETVDICGGEVVEIPNDDPLRAFLRDCSETAYPEPVSKNTDAMASMAVDELSKHLPPGSAVLDIGVGNGAAMKRLKELGHFPAGITVSEGEARVLSEQGLNVMVCDMHDFHQVAFPMMGVMARHVLEHSPAPLFVLRQIAEITLPGGWLYVEVPAPDTICRHETNPNHYSVFGLTMWGNLLSKAGFIVQRHAVLPVLTGAGPDAYFWFLAQKPKEEKK